MNRQVIFLFHINQNLGQFAPIADSLCYEPLIKMLLGFKTERFCLHVSPCLLSSLKFYSSPTIPLIKKGINEGMFELTGSTFAQNVYYSTGKESNRIQLDTGLRLIKKVLNSAPTGFWMPERCWRPRDIEDISRAGYRYSFVEEQILNDNGVPVDKNPARIKYKNSSLIVLRDHEQFKHTVNMAIWSGLNTYALDYINNTKSGLPLLYAEDGEATGLWGWHKGVPPETARLNLKKLIQECIKNGVEFVTPADVLRGRKKYTSYQFKKHGQAAWMTASAKHEKKPYHEPGFRDWFDFNRRAPKLNKYSKLFKEILTHRKEIIQKIPEKSAAVKRLIILSDYVYAAHQYEFGCIGIGGINVLFWEGVKKSLVPLYAAICTPEKKNGGFLDIQEFRSTSNRLKIQKEEKVTPEGGYLKDVNLDGRDEICVLKYPLLYIFGQNSRLLYLYDVEHGREIVGAGIVPEYDNKNMNDYKFRDIEKWNSKFPIRRMSADELKKIRKKVKRDDVWYRYHLDKWGLESLPDYLYDYRYPANEKKTAYIFHPRMRMLNEFFISRHKKYNISELKHKYEYSNDTLHFRSRFEGKTFHKRISFRDDGFVATCDGVQGVNGINGLSVDTLGLLEGSEPVRISCGKKDLYINGCGSKIHIHTSGKISEPTRGAFEYIFETTGSEITFMYRNFVESTSNRLKIQKKKKLPPGGAN